MIKELTILANELDLRGLNKEANYLDVVIRKIARVPFGLISLVKRIEKLEEEAANAAMEAAGAGAQLPGSEELYAATDAAGAAVKSKLDEIRESLDSLQREEGATPELEDAQKRIEKLEEEAAKATKASMEAAESIHKEVDPGNDALKAYLLDPSKGFPARDALLARLAMAEVFRGGGEAAANVADRMLSNPLYRNLTLEAFVKDNGAMKLERE